jgi:hypothetical protein
MSAGSPAGQASSPEADEKPDRPKSVTMLAVMVLILAGLNLDRLIQSLLQWNFLQALLPISPVFLAASGLVWGAAALVLFVGLWSGRSWAHGLARWGSLAFFLYHWLDRLLLENPVTWRFKTPFFIGLTVLTLGLVFWILSRPKVKSFFRRSV